MDVYYHFTVTSNNPKNVELLMGPADHRYFDIYSRSVIGIGIDPPNASDIDGVFIDEEHALAYYGNYADDAQPVFSIFALLNMDNSTNFVAGNFVANIPEVQAALDLKQDAIVPGANIADATNSTDVVTQFNTLLSTLESLGILEST